MELLTEILLHLWEGGVKLFSAFPTIPEFY